MKSNQLVYLDTNIFVYHFKQDSIWGVKAKKIFDVLSTHKVRAATSVLTQLELLSLSASPDDLKILLGAFLEIPNLQLENVTSEIAIIAARMRRQYGFRTPDAVHLATALFLKVDVFITNDKRLAKCKEIKIDLL